MQKSIKKSAVSVLLFLAFQQIASPKDANTGRRLSVVERAVIFSIQREIEASNLPAKRDLCIGFDQGLALDEKAIISSLKRKGMHVHADEWCIQGPRGFRVGIIAPINETPQGTYEINVQVDDLSIQPGEHFATLLKRGTYVIRCEKGSEPLLLSYRQSCCSKTS